MFFTAKKGGIGARMSHLAQVGALLSFFLQNETPRAWRHRKALGQLHPAMLATTGFLRLKGRFYIL